MRPTTKNSLLILFFVCTTFLMNAQSFDRPNGFGGQLLLIDHESFREDGDFSFEDFTTGFELSYSRHLNKFLSIRLPFKGGIVRDPLTKFANNRYFVGADLTVQATYFGNNSLIAPFIYTGFGGTKEEDEDIYSQIPVGTGLNIRIGPWGYVQLKAEYRADLQSELERTNIQYGIGLVAVMGPSETTKAQEKMMADTDGDGIEDEKDRCPEVAGNEIFGGCPDTDEDGIGDADDSCPDAVGLKELNGCPDSDADGVADIVDDCPDTPGTADGCPDKDHDGVADAVDKCPDIAGAAEFGGCIEEPTEDVAEVEIVEEDLVEKGGEENLADTDGDGYDAENDECPDLAGTLAGCPDSDEDGVADHKDNCPNTRGTTANAGCPEVNSIAAPSTNSYTTTEYSYDNNVITETATSLMSEATRMVQFRKLHHRLMESSFEVLDQVADLMLGNPQLKLKVSGHTDSRGEDSVNQRLSEKRARSCVRYLRDRGVPESQMSYIGYGARFPIEDNDTAYGRSQNRRVDFELYTSY